MDITTAFSGNNLEYSTPPKGIIISCLTHAGWAGEIVRGSLDGKFIAYLSNDNKGVAQVTIIPADGSDLSEDKEKQPKQVTLFKSNASSLRWYPSGEWIFSIVDGNIAVTSVKSGTNFGKTIIMHQSAGFLLI